MGIYERDYKTSKFTDSLQSNALVQLITLNLVVFVLFQFVRVFYMFTFTGDANGKFMQDVYMNLAIPASLDELIRKPWTLITQMFYHHDIWHILGNMLWLWMFGYLFLDLTGNKRIIPLFIYSAIGGALAFILAYNIFPNLNVNANMIGASGGIMGIVVATTILAPGYRIFPMINGGIPLWVLTTIFLIIDLALMPNMSNTGGHIAHLAGGFTGFLFILSMRKGYDWSVPINNFFDWVSNLFNPDKPKKKIKEQLFYKSQRKPYTKTPNLSQQRIDEILDKINMQGFNSLTAEEKELLKKASKEDL